MVSDCRTDGRGGYWSVSRRRSSGIWTPIADPAPSRCGRASLRQARVTPAARRLRTGAASRIMRAPASCPTTRQRMALERPAIAEPARPAAFWRDVSLAHTASGLAGFLFAATGPVAVILATGTRGGLSEADLASWVFGAFFINGF